MLAACWRGAPRHLGGVEDAEPLEVAVLAGQALNPNAPLTGADPLDHDRTILAVR